MEARLVRLRDKGGFHPRVIYDIGAYQGEFTALCQRVWPQTRVVQFEANDTLENATAVTPTDAYYGVLLGDEDAKPVIYYKTPAACATGNSMFCENSGFFADATPESREMVRLDSFVERHQIPLPDFLKLDTQGSELLILKGANMCITHARVILLEVALHAYNSGAPLIAEVLEFMQKEHGFHMMDIVELHYAAKTENLFQIDVLLCREKDPYLFQSRF